MMVADLTAVVLHSGTNFIGLLTNALLIYLALTVTPKSIRTYSILILNFGITDFCGCLMGLFVQQRYVVIASVPGNENKCSHVLLRTKHQISLKSQNFFRLIPVGLSVTYISNGPCTVFGTSACYLG